MRSARSLAGFLAVAMAVAGLLAACSGDEEEVELLPSGIGEIAGAEDDGGGAGEAVAAPEGEAPIKEARTVVVEEAAFYADEALLDRILARDSAVEKRVFNDIMTVLSFPDSRGRRPDSDPAPDVVKVMRWEQFAVLKRTTRRGQRQFLEDMEVFLTFNAAFEDMTGEDQGRLLRRWRKSAGTKEPPKPTFKGYPLFWLRDSIPFWGQGGRNWWWAYHALAQDPGFRFTREEGAVYVAPDETVYLSRERE
jgi:hypothetical protein